MSQWQSREEIHQQLPEKKKEEEKQDDQFHEEAKLDTVNEWDHRCEVLIHGIKCVWFFFNKAASTAKKEAIEKGAVADFQGKADPIYIFIVHYVKIPF